MNISLRLSDYLKTLSEASFDNAKAERLIESDFQAYKLDTLTVQVCRELRNGQTLSGCDAYLKSNGTYWFIEFKNQYADTINQKTVQQIWRKAYDSVSTVGMAIEKTITLDDLCHNAAFLVVFRDEEEAGLDAIQKQVSNLSEDEPVYWGLRKIEGKLYREVHTIPATEFQQTWIPRIWGK